MAELLLAGAPRRSKDAAARLRHGTALLQSKGADNAKAPLRGKGAGRKQELARGVRS